MVVVLPNPEAEKLPAAVEKFIAEKGLKLKVERYSTNTGGNHWKNGFYVKRADGTEVLNFTFVPFYKNATWDVQKLKHWWFFGWHAYWGGYESISNAEAFDKLKSAA